MLTAERHKHKKKTEHLWSLIKKGCGLINSRMKTKVTSKQCLIVEYKIRGVLIQKISNPIIIVPRCFAYTHMHRYSETMTGFRIGFDSWKRYIFN